MPFTSRSANALTTKRRQALTGPTAGSRRDPAVIHTYARLRNRLFDEARKMATPHKLLRVTLANNFVLACLKMRPIGLGKLDIERERERCETVRSHVAKLTIRTDDAS